MSRSNRTAGYWTLLVHNRNYRSLWLGEVVSLFGDWFNLIASASLVSSLTQSGFAVGGLFAVRMLAPFVISPLAGVVSDRFNRKTILIAADLLRFVIVLGFLTVRDAGDVGLLYVLTALQLGISGFFFPARNALLPDLVARSELGTANALSSITWSTMLAVGAAVGGLVAGQLGIYPAFGIDALSFLLSALFLARIGSFPRREAAGEASLGGFLRQYLEGLDFLRHHRDVLAIALHKAAFSLTVNGVFQVVMVILAEQVFVIGERGGTSLGWMYAVAGLGTGLGPFLARELTGDEDRPVRLALILAYAMGVLGLAISAPLASFGMVLVGNFLRAFGGGINWVFSTQLLLNRVPDQMRGRVFSTEFALFTLFNALSTVLGGWLLDQGRLDVSGLLWLTAFLTAVPGVLWAWWVLRGRLRTGVAPIDPDGG